MRKRILTALLATIMTIGALTGCSNKDTASGSNKEGGNSAGGDKVNLNVWIMPNTPEPENDFMQVIQPFLDENPDISVPPNCSYTGDKSSNAPIAPNAATHVEPICEISGPSPLVAAVVSCRRK